MNIRFVLPALLALCGATYFSPVHAAEYRCMVFSGADGSKVEGSSSADGKYLIKADTPAAAEAGALAAATRYKKGKVTLTKAQCDAVTGTSGTATPEPAATTTAPAPAAAPVATSGAGKTMYCMIYEGGKDLAPPEALKADAKIWRVAVQSSQTSEDDAVALAKAQGMNADSAMCEGSVAAFSSESY